MHDGRWQSEQTFFDRIAEEHAVSVRLLDERDLWRYRTENLRRRFAGEFRLRTVGGVAGKRILDVGCGEGGETVRLARLGAAEVTGIDLSPRALQLAEARAWLNGVADRVRLVCAPVETVQLAPASFDVIWCNAILHHLTDSLESVLGRLVGWCKPDGILSFCEPTNFSPWLRRLRLRIPIATGTATPDERPLEPHDIAILRQHVPDLAMRHFGLLGRVDQFVLTRFNYERSSWPRRAFVNGTATLDWLLLSLPGANTLGSVTVLWGHPA
jgi:2-polyprenyl-3-methyl-5-hydroxy-6-metoxy-1,4-benzoquinol methylase